MFTRKENEAAQAAAKALDNRPDGGNFSANERRAAIQAARDLDNASEAQGRASVDGQNSEDSEPTRDSILTLIASLEVAIGSKTEKVKDVIAALKKAVHNSFFFSEATVSKLSDAMNAAIASLNAAAAVSNTPVPQTA